MPKGVPKLGFRLTKGRADAMRRMGRADELDALIAQLKPIKEPKRRGRPPKSPPALTFQVPRLHLVSSQESVPTSATETDSQIAARLKTRFDTIEKLVEVAVQGELRALIVAGPGGLGKSYSVQRALNRVDPNGVKTKTVKGFVTPTGLYKMLFEHRFKGQVLVFDDADDIFKDETALNFLKAACDTTDTRRLTYFTKNTMYSEGSEDFPPDFEYEGTILFLSNYDFRAMAEKGGKLGPHFQALMTRSHYVDCDMNNIREYVVRIEQVMNEEKMLINKGFTIEQSNEVLAFIKQHQNELNDVSLRIAVKLAGLLKSYPGCWREMAKVTCCRRT